MMDYLTKLKKQIKGAVLSNFEDSGKYQIALIDFLGKVGSRAISLSPFGVWGHPPRDSLAVAFNISGKESDKAAIVNDYLNRPVRNLKEGECVIGNLKSYFHFKEDGTVVLAINGETRVQFGSENTVIEGDVRVINQLFASDYHSHNGIQFNSHVHPENDGGDTGAPR